MQAKFQFLGTGASSGVPLIGCHCPVCSSTSPYDKRLRPAGWVQAGGLSLLFDAGPDFRQQALRAGIEKVDALFLTHTHYDHIAGIDELRIFYLHHKKHLPCYLSLESLDDLKKRYSYFFEPIREGASLSARFDFHLLEGEVGEVALRGKKVSYFSYAQVGMKVNGFRLGEFAYLTDIRDYPQSLFSHLRGVRYLALGALSPEPSKIHFSFEEAIHFAKRVGAQETYFTHMSHNITHEEGGRLLPVGMSLAYDGLSLEFQWTD